MVKKSFQISEMSWFRVMLGFSEVKRLVALLANSSGKSVIEKLSPIPIMTSVMRPDSIELMASVRIPAIFLLLR